MTYALIDNSTLTAVQRIQGDVLTKSKDSIDADIVALENFVQAILFYDQIIAIDDYVPKCRVPDEYLVHTRRPLLMGREVLKATLAHWSEIREC